MCTSTNPTLGSILDQETTRAFSILVPQMDRSTNTSNTGSTYICLWMQYERISVLIIVVLEVPSLIPETLIYQCSSFNTGAHFYGVLPTDASTSRGYFTPTFATTIGSVMDTLVPTLVLLIL